MIKPTMPLSRQCGTFRKKSTGTNVPVEGKRAGIDGKKRERVVDQHCAEEIHPEWLVKQAQQEAKKTSAGIE